MSGNIFRAAGATLALGFFASTALTPVPASAGSLKDDVIIDDVRAAATWDGFYVGGSLGALFDRGADKTGRDLEDLDDDNNHDDDDDDDRNAVLDALGRGDDTAFLGGLHIGLNRQSGHIVYGVEADITFASDIEYLASVRGRVGIARDHMLIYGTAGVAFFERDSDNVTDNFPGVDLGHDDNHVGFVVGGGAEFMIGHSLSVGAEALYYSFDDDDREIDFNGANGARDVHMDNDFWAVRGRVSYRFGGHHAMPLGDGDSFK
ncbi:MAG: outer membrane beta-barrel protein [Pseudomonadota bacterium]